MITETHLPEFTNFRTRSSSLNANFRINAPLFSLLASLILPLVIALSLYFFAGSYQWMSNSVHTAIEGVESVVIFILALFLYVQKDYEQEQNCFVWTSGALILLGALNLSTSLVQFGYAFHYSRTVAALLSGLLLNLVWLPMSNAPKKILRFYPWMVATLIGGSLYALFFFQNYLPYPMLPNYAYRPEFRLANILAAFEFFLASIFFLRKFQNMEEQQSSLVLAGYFLIYGMSRLLLNLAKMWDPVWWFLYGLRVVASLMVLYYLFSIFRKALATAVTSNFQLERKVHARTSELAHSNAALRSQIQERERAEAQLKEAVKYAKEANDLKSAFLANMSHEIRTPLGVVLGFTELLRDPKMKTDEKERCFEIIQRNGEQLSNLINDILDLSKVEAGQIQVERLPVNIRSILQEVITELQPQAQKKNLRLNCQIEAPVPGVIDSDPTRLKQILINVIGNAIKFTDQGFVHVQISDEGPQIRILVQDSGIGMSPSQMSKLFQAFTQVDPSSTRKFGGTGLGLILSKKLAHALGGDLHIKSSTPGVGSVFEITLAKESNP